MGPMIFAFSVIFGVLSGWTGAFVASRLRGWLAVLLGLMVSATAMAVFIAIQLGLLNFLGGENGLDQLLVTGAILVAVLSWVWGPAFGLFYWRMVRGRDL
nr:hypothetical protein [Amylibacter sp.]